MVLFTLYENGAIKFSEIYWNDKFSGPQTSTGEEEDAPLVEDYYRLMAAFLDRMANQENSTPDTILEFFKSNNLNQVFSKMKPLILEDSLFDDIEETFGGKHKA